MEESFEQTLQIHLWADVRAPGSARQLVRQLDWLPERAAEAAALVASELVSNAVAHAGPGDADSIGLRLSRATERLIIEAQLANLGSADGRLRVSNTAVGEPVGEPDGPERGHSAWRSSTGSLTIGASTTAAAGLRFVSEDPLGHRAATRSQIRC